MAWGQELRRVHARLREALSVTLSTSDPRDLLLFCHGFCSALDGHHRGEDRTLFPAIAAAHPELQDTLRNLEQDHSMIAHLLSGLQSAVDRSASPEQLRRHLRSVAPIMENHFRYEERALLTVLEGLTLDASGTQVLGPL
ncbi:hypothetical protein JCM9957A_03330 [Kineosporia succinea]